MEAITAHGQRIKGKIDKKLQREDYRKRIDETGLSSTAMRFSPTTPQPNLTGCVRGRISPMLSGCKKGNDSPRRHEHFIPNIVFHHKYFISLSFFPSVRKMSECFWRAKMNPRTE
jgi:hypothetical protein